MNLTSLCVDFIDVWGIAISKPGVYAIVAMLLIAALGYLLGSITVKGVNLGTSGVFLVAIGFGCLICWKGINVTPISGFYAFGEHGVELMDAFGLFQDLGLVLFVTSVGFVAGPRFFHDLKKNATSYVLLGVIVICTGALLCIVFALIPGIGPEYSAGLLSGALTTTPGYSAALGAAGEAGNLVTLGHAVAYPFGVIGVVLFVQLVPKIMKVDYVAERAKMGVTAAVEEKKEEKKLFEFDEFGICVFAIAVLLGVALGSVKIPLSCDGYAKGAPKFSLGNTGGPLIVSLIIGHFGKIGKVSLRVPDRTLKVFREFGLMLFLIGAGVDGGVKLIEEIANSSGKDVALKVLYGFLSGAAMTIVPMFAGFLFAKFVLKIPLFNNLGSICGGMTSTPALGSLISSAGTEDVAGAYAATYPLSLVLVTIACNLIVSLM